jgi:hypothetical protein
MKWNEDSALRSAWRRIFTRSPLAIEVLKEGKRYVKKFNKGGEQSKKDSMEYLCNVCKNWVKASVGGKSNVAVDHIIPVIAVEDIGGKIHDWNLFKSRLFCPKSNLQIICKPCHLLKTSSEKKARNALHDRVLLDDIAVQIKVIDSIDHAKNLMHQVKKFLAKTKAEETKQRALELRLHLKDILEKQD